METVLLDDFDAKTVENVAGALDEGGLVSLPVNGSYRILADLENERAVLDLLQTKRRVKKAPSLVFIADTSMLHRVVREVDPVVKPLYRAFWPGPLTIRFEASEELPRKVMRELVKATGRVGVRVPEDEHVRDVLRELGRPVLVSSANRARKPGESSRAQVRQNFGRGVAFFVDAGDLSGGKSSTVVEAQKGRVKVIREGAISVDQITECTG